MKTLQSVLLVILSVIIFSCAPKEGPKSPAKENQAITNQQVAPQKTTDGKINLRLNLVKGKTYYLKMLTDQKITQTIEKTKNTTKQKIGVGFSYYVESIDNKGNATIKVTYNSFLQEMDGPMGKISYNSDVPADKDKPFAKIYNVILGKGFKMTLSPNGVVLSLNGVDELLKSMIKSMNLPPEADMKAVEASLKEQFGDNAVKEMMTNLMANYPDHPVAIGESWAKSYDMVKGFPAHFDNTWTLKEIKNNSAIVSVNTKIKPFTPPEASGANSPASYKITGEQAGTIEYDLASGWTSKAKLNQTFSGKITIKKSERVPKDMVMPIMIESVITIEPVK